MRKLGVLVFASITACSGPHVGEPTDASTPTVTIAPTEAPPPASTGTSEPSATPPSSSGLTGTFTSASCDKRSYPREITFGSGGRFDASDLISPCPPNARCVWSGIVPRSGTFTLSGATVTLAIEGDAPSQGAPFPTTLTFSDGVLSETASGAACAYQRR